MTVVMASSSASPSLDPHVRQARYRKSLGRWAELLVLLSQRDGEHIESVSDLWPPPFANASIPPSFDRHAIARHTRPSAALFSSGIKVHQRLQIPGFECRPTAAIISRRVPKRPTSQWLHSSSTHPTLRSSCCRWMRPTSQ